MAAEETNEALRGEAEQGQEGKGPPHWAASIFGGMALVLFVTILVSPVFVLLIVRAMYHLAQTNTELNPLFTWSSMTMLGLISMRFLAIYFGATVMLAGTAVAFHALEGQSQASGEVPGGFKAALATTSPGLLVVTAGAVVICVALITHIPNQYQGEVSPPPTKSSITHIPMSNVAQQLSDAMPPPPSP